MSRTNRRPYTGSKRHDRSCRSHGSCPYCQAGRKHKRKRQEPGFDSNDPSLTFGGLNGRLTD